MKTPRDTDLGDRLGAFDAPEHGTEYWQSVDQTLEAAGTVPGAGRAGRAGEPPAGSGGEPHTGWRRWRRPALATAAAIAACAGLALALTGVPGTTRLGPAPAGAVVRLLAEVDAGLAKIQTLQGVMISHDRGGGQSRVQFAVTAAGDDYSRLTQAPTARGLRFARRMYLDELARMRAGDTPWDRAQLRRDRLEVTGMEWAADAQARTSALRVAFVDAFTGKPAGVNYGKWTGTGGRSSESAELDAASAANAWGLSSAVRLAIAEHGSGVSIGDTTVAGRPATRVVIPVGGGGTRPATEWVAIIDKEYGLAMSFRPLHAAGGGQVAAYAAFRLTGVKVNQPIPRSRFTIPPVFSLDATWRHIPFERHDPAPYTQDAATQIVPLAQTTTADVDFYVSGVVPAGLHADPSAVVSAHDRGMVTYARGLDTVTMKTSMPTTTFASRDRSTWNDLGGGAIAMEGAQVLATRGGAFDGWPLQVQMPRLESPRGTDWYNAGINLAGGSASLSVRGVLSQDQALRMAESARPARGWSIVGRPTYQYARVLLAATIATIVLALLLEIGAAVRGGGRPRLRGAELLALAGCVALALSMWLPWYRLVDAPLHAHYELLGASIPAPAMSLACALGAAVVALLRAAMGGWRLPARESVLLAVFGVVSLGLVMYARLVQPAQARFVISRATLDDAVWPRPWLGLLLGLAGAGAILIAALLARSHRAQPMESKPQTR